MFGELLLSFNSIKIGISYQLKNTPDNTIRDILKLIFVSNEKLSATETISFIQKSYPM